MTTDSEQTLAGLRQIVALQAEDACLWSPALYCSEAYIQQALRTLTEAIEGKTSVECALDVVREMMP